MIYLVRKLRVRFINFLPFLIVAWSNMVPSKLKRRLNYRRCIHNPKELGILSTALSNYAIKHEFSDKMCLPLDMGDAYNKMQM